MSAQADKQTLRSGAIAARKALSDAERCRYSSQLIDRLLKHLESLPTRPRTLLAYRSMPSEVNTETLLHLPDYDIYAPVTHHHEYMQWKQVTPVTHWQKGNFGILEPSSGPEWQESSHTVLIAPLTAFDRNGNRLGMGKGCFDFWLAGARQHLMSVIGLAYACQEVAQIPCEGHDAPMDTVITEKETIACRKH